MNNFSQLESKLKVDGVFAVKIRPIQSTELEFKQTTLVDKIALEAGCRPLGTQWRKLIPKEGFEFIEDVYGHDLAYRSKRSGFIDREYDPADLTLTFLDIFDGHIDFYTNVMANPIWTPNYSWTPTTNWTFDCTIIAISAETIGLICFADED